MDNQEYYGKILLQGFDEEEIEEIKKILDKYDKRLKRHDYKEIRLTLQRHQKGEGMGKSYLNEINGLLKLEKGLFHAKITSHEFYPAITKVMEKLIQEAEHLMKLEKKRRGQRRLR